MGWREDRADEDARDEARRKAWGDGVYDAWKGFAPDPSLTGNLEHADAYRDGYEHLD